MSLPNTYKQVEYIESRSSGAGTSSTGQYINTGYKPNNKTKAVFKIGNWTNTGSSSNDIFGEDNGWSVASGFSLIAGYYNFGVGVTYAHNFNDGNVHTGELSQQGLYKDGTLLVTPSTYTFTGLDLYLFALNRSGVVQEHSSGRIYYLKLYDNGTLVRDFVPVVRKSDNKPGMYDLVNNVFYTNQGTGEFEYPKESGKITHIYLGTNLIRPDENITKTYTLQDNVSLYMAGYRPKSIIYELDYYNPSSGWTGCTLKIKNGSSNIGWYIWGGSNIGSYSNSDGKIEGNTGSGITKIYDSTHKYISAGSTVHLKITFNREGISLKVGSNAEETYLYSSGSWGPAALSIMDSTDLLASYGASSGASLSNGVATVTYEPV